jgi:hypothetical protein
MLINLYINRNFEYLEYAKGTDKTVMNRHSYLMGGYPSMLEKKVTLLQHFKNYMQENLYKVILNADR